MKITKSHLQRIIKEEVNKITEGEGWETYRQGHREETYGSDFRDRYDPSDPSSTGESSLEKRARAHSTTDAGDEELKREQSIKRLEALERLVKNTDLSDDDGDFFMDMKQKIESGIGPDYFERQRARTILYTNLNKHPDWELFESKEMKLTKSYLRKLIIREIKISIGGSMAVEEELGDGKTSVTPEASPYVTAGPTSYIASHDLEGGGTASISETEKNEETTTTQKLGEDFPEGKGKEDYRKEESRMKLTKGGLRSLIEKEIKKFGKKHLGHALAGAAFLEHDKEEE